MGKFEDAMARRQAKLAPKAPQAPAAQPGFTDRMNLSMAQGSGRERMLQEQFGGKEPEGFSIADYAGPAVEYGSSAIGGLLGAPLGPAGVAGGSILGQMAGNYMRQGTAAAMGYANPVAESSMDALQSGGEAIVGAAGGRAIQAGADLLTPGARLAKRILSPSSQKLVQSENPWTRVQKTGLDDIPFASAQELPHATNPLMDQTLAHAANPPSVLADTLPTGVGALGLGYALNNPMVTAGVVGAKVGHNAFKNYSAQKIAKIVQQPNGMALLKELAAPGTRTARVSEITRLFSSMGIDSEMP